MSLYDPYAAWYDAWLGDDPVSDHWFFADAEALMGDVAGQRVCDLACGEGRVARHLADHGASVVGVDISANMLAIARRREAEAPRGILYVQDDASRAERLEDGAFDGVICFMALMDIADLDGAIRTVARILRPHGWFVFTILHPCFNTARSGEIESDIGCLRTVGGYFEQGYWRSETRTGPPGKVGCFHRTLSTYVNTLVAAGLTLERMVEPRLDGNQAAKRPVWAEVPAMLTVKCRKI